MQVYKLWCKYMLQFIPCSKRDTVNLHWFNETEQPDINWGGGEVIKTFYIRNDWDVVNDIERIDSLRDVS